MATPRPRETDLYDPIKRLLESQGYEVKGEVGAADIVARRGAEEPVVIELKTGFALALFHQAIERQAMTDAVYVAVPRGGGAAFRRALRSNAALCRRLGLGLITVRLRDGHVEVQVDPAPYRPRRSPRRRKALLREFSRRSGDPNSGGMTRRGVVTAYRQDALRCLRLLGERGPSRAADVAQSAGVPEARRIMYADHYGWFVRPAKGIYALSGTGEAALIEYRSLLETLPDPAVPSQTTDSPA